MTSTPTCTVCGAHATEYAVKNTHTLYRCTGCGLVFVFPIPDPTELYSEGYFTGASVHMGYANYDADKEPMIPTFETYLAYIDRFAPGKRLLDVGAATGFFLDIARRKGFVVSGVELSEYAATCATQKGLSVIAGTLQDVPRTEQFDTVTMLDVIEHVGDPRAECVRAHTLLAPGGVLIINAPDIGSLYARILGKRWHLIVPPEHLFYFNRKNIRHLLEQTGYEVCLITTVGKRFTLQLIFKTLFVWQKLKVWKWFSDLCARSWLRHIWLPINLGDNMFVVARKRA